MASFGVGRRHERQILLISGHVHPKMITIVVIVIAVVIVVKSRLHSVHRGFQSGSRRR